MQESQQQQPTGKAKAKAKDKDQSNQPRRIIKMIEDRERSIKNRSCVYSRDPRLLEPKFTLTLEKLSTRYLTALQYLDLAVKRLLILPNDEYTTALIKQIAIFLEDQK